MPPSTAAPSPACPDLTCPALPSDRRDQAPRAGERHMDRMTLVFVDGGTFPLEPHCPVHIPTLRGFSPSARRARPSAVGRRQSRRCRENRTTKIDHKKKAEGAQLAHEAADMRVRARVPACTRVRSMRTRDADHASHRWPGVHAWPWIDRWPDSQGPQRGVARLRRGWIGRLAALARLETTMTTDPSRRLMWVNALPDTHTRDGATPGEMDLVPLRCCPFGRS